MSEKNTGSNTVAQNKKAYHDYFVLETYEAGIELVGTEVKSLRQGKCNLKDSWCNIDGGEIFVNGMHISPYEHGNIFNRDPRSTRKVRVGLCKGKKLYDKRDTAAKKEAQRNIERGMKERLR